MIFESELMMNLFIWGQIILFGLLELIGATLQGMMFLWAVGGAIDLIKTIITEVKKKFPKNDLGYDDR